MIRVHATAVRDGGHWLVRNEQYPSAFTTVTRLADAADAHREAVAFVVAVAEDQVEVEVRAVLPGGLSDLVAEARLAVRSAEDAQIRAAALSRKAVSELLGAGLTGVDAAEVLEVSPQRVSQLAKA